MISASCAPRVGAGEGLFAVESFATVHQMTSLVRGQLKAPPALGTLLRALFPCGSITGAPKFRAMETLRAWKTGLGGFTAARWGGWPPMDARSSTWRSGLALDEAGRLAVGSGVVYDSVAEAEYEEALWKARFATLSPETAPNRDLLLVAGNGSAEWGRSLGAPSPVR